MQKRILLVEDEEHLHEAIKMNLEMENYIVNSVYNGKNAISKFKEGRYDLVILDVMLKYSKKFDKKLLDPVWETVGMKIQKYKPFLNINVDKFKKILLERLK